MVLLMSDPDVNRLRWKCRRGMLELDAWLAGFVDEVYPGLDAEQQAAFARLLDEEDPDLYDWLTGRGNLPVHYRDVIRSITQLKVKPT